MTQSRASQKSVTEAKPLRPFFIIWGGQTVSLLGSSLVQFALIWYLTTTTGSATVLAIASIMGLLPQILLAPIAGVFIDRWNRRLVMISADTITAAATLLLALCFLFDWVPLWLIYLVLFIRSLGEAFHGPALRASTPLLVSKKQLTRIAGLNRGVEGAANLLVPPVAALLLAWLPLQGILAIDVGTAIIAIIPLLFIPIPNPIRHDLIAPDQRTRPSIFDDLRAGFAFIWRWTGLLLTFGVGLILNIFLTPAMLLLPILVTETFSGGALALAWVQASWGLGIVLGGLLLGVWGGFQNRMVTVLAGTGLMGIGAIVVGFIPATLLPLLMVALFFNAIMNTVLRGTLTALLQVIVPNAMQGRVFTVFSSLNNAMAPFGLLIAAPIADTVGVQLWFMLAGIVMLILCIGCFFIPAVLHLEAQGKERAVGAYPKAATEF